MAVLNQSVIHVPLTALCLYKTLTLHAQGETLVALWCESAQACQVAAAHAVRV